MSGQSTRRIPEAGRKAAAVVSAYMLQTARPLFWHIGVMTSGELRGASTFVLQFEQRHVAVTADHVMAQYIDARTGNPRTVCQIGQCQVWPERSLIARSARLDIAVFEVDARQLEAMGAVPFDCRVHWPPPDVAVGDTLTLAGYLDTRRTRISHGHYEMEAFGAHGVADAVSDRDILTIYDPATTFATSDDVAKPPLGFNMSGCSGGPAIVVKEVNVLIPSEAAQHSEMMPPTIPR